MRSASIALGGPAQGQLAQRRQVLGLEEALAGARRHVLDIDLALGEAFQQLLGRQIDEDEVVGFLEHAVGHRLAHLHARDPLHDVAEAFEVLDVERGPHVDACREQLLDVLPALQMAAARNVGMGELIDEQQARAARERLVDVELAQDPVDVDDGLARDDLEALDERLGLAPTVRLDEAEHHLAPFGPGRAGRIQHGVGLADAGGRAEEDLQPAAMLLLREGKQGVG